MRITDAILVGLVATLAMTTRDVQRPTAIRMLIIDAASRALRREGALKHADRWYSLRAASTTT